ncbi:MAG: hypothetical protein ACPGOY_18340 [Rhodospirillaceae bacterium]
MHTTISESCTVTDPQSGSVVLYLEHDARFDVTIETDEDGYFLTLEAGTEQLLTHRIGYAEAEWVPFSDLDPHIASICREQIEALLADRSSALSERCVDTARQDFADISPPGRAWSLHASQQG